MDNTHDLVRLLHERGRLTKFLSEHPYSSATYTKRAECHEQLGYPDLAVGDVYRALLLIDEMSDESGEYHKETLEAFRTDFRDSEPVKGDTDNVLIPLIDKHRLHCFAMLSRSLIKCGCLRSAYDFAERGLKASPRDATFLSLRRHILKTYNTLLLEKDPNWSDWSCNPKTDLPEQGDMKRELHAWNDCEPDRLSEESLRSLNESMKRVAPKCEVRTVSLRLLEKDTVQDPSNPSPTIKQLGIFATEDIAPGETVLLETSLLAANNRLYDPLCDACSAPLPAISASGGSLPTCPECDDIIFCSKSCHDAAMSSYHGAICGTDADAVARDPSPLAATNALYLLLLGRTFALSETQNIHPLELSETKYLWGDFAAPPLSSSSFELTPSARKLPFTFEDNILAPLHLFEKMGINIFTSLATTDTWIISTLFAKFRGVASARMSPRTGMPEVCAVHSMWSLANHSCAPNVKWEWAGSMRLTARGGEDVVEWGGMDKVGREGGIKKGQEILSHYCDIDLNVNKRREWAEGALGGICMCERCLWEEREANIQDGETIHNGDTVPERKVVHEGKLVHGKRNI
ncbi:MAG: hypothetical protein L6R41_004364 [Letrouitia leprolyta]|nr:MAG: hypothetical protein L6R41_004364 [Letrouitia leprolyta]